MKLLQLHTEIILRIVYLQERIKTAVFVNFIFLPSNSLMSKQKKKKNLSVSIYSVNTRKIGIFNVILNLPFLNKNKENGFTGRP